MGLFNIVEHQKDHISCGFAVTILHGLWHNGHMKTVANCVDALYNLVQGRVNSSKFVEQDGATSLIHANTHATLLQNRAFPRQSENWPRLRDKATHLCACFAEVGHPFRPSSHFSKAYRKLSYRGNHRRKYDGRRVQSHGVRA